jgi:hypothetical protein
MTTLWVLCPMYFDVESFLTLRTEILAERRRLDFTAPERLQFAVVDDSGDQDPAIERVRALPDVTVVSVPFNLGHQRAIVFGLRRLADQIETDDWVVTMDADGEDQPGDLSRLLRPLAAFPTGSTQIVLAWRTKRRETLTFKALYSVFKIMFRVLTGTVIRTGNYAAFRGTLTKQIVLHPYFDLSYASTLLSLNLKATFVPCERGRRYAGESRLGLRGLIMHGLRMLMPFIDRIAVRALIGSGAVFALGIASALAVLAVRLLTTWSIPAWTPYLLLSIVLLSFTALGQFVILFILFAQSDGLSLRGVHGRTFVFPAEESIAETASARGIGRR